VALLQAILGILQDIPFYGYRKVTLQLQRDGIQATRKQVRRIMHRAGLRAIYPGKRTSIPNKQHQVYPYLLRGKKIWIPNQVWATDITYIKLRGSFVYLVAILDLFSRKVLSWKLSNTMDTAFCVAALEEAIAKYGTPAIFNTDQGSQFTALAFIEVLKSHRIAISMDGVKRCLDNIYVERLWRSVKYEEVYIKDYQNMNELSISLGRYFHFYNTERFHESLDYRTPDEIYSQVFQHMGLKTQAA
jgi:putative transposase